MKDARQIHILLHCHHLPGIAFEERTQIKLGVQKGREVVDDVFADLKQVTFRVPLRVERNPQNGQPNFLGPYAHGTPDARFIYLSWGERKNGTWDGFRRAKIHLSQIGWETIEASCQTEKPIEADLEMTDEKGGPLCASVKNEKIKWKGAD